MSHETYESLKEGSLIIGSKVENHNIEWRGNLELMRKDEATSQALDTIREVFWKAIIKVLDSGDLEKLKLPTDDYIQLRLTIKNGKIS